MTRLPSSRSSLFHISLASSQVDVDESFLASCVSDWRLHSLKADLAVGKHKYRDTVRSLLLLFRAVFPTGTLEHDLQMINPTFATSAVRRRERWGRCDANAKPAMNDLLHHCQNNHIDNCISTNQDAKSKFWITKHPVLHTYPYHIPFISPSHQPSPPTILTVSSHIPAPTQMRLQPPAR